MILFGFVTRFLNFKGSFYSIFFSRLNEKVMDGENGVFSRIDFY